MLEAVITAIAMRPTGADVTASYSDLFVVNSLKRQSDLIQD